MKASDNFAADHVDACSDGVFEDFRVFGGRPESGDDFCFSHSDTCKE